MANNQAPSFLQYEASSPKQYLTDSFTDGAELNTQPVIGIVTQTLEDAMKGDTRFDGYTSYIMHSYVDFVQSSGARVVPLIVTEDQSVTIEKLSHLNAVLMPGGDGDYLTYGNFVYDKIKEYND
jgi:gamma-glutamyl hydrolase